MNCQAGSHESRVWVKAPVGLEQLCKHLNLIYFRATQTIGVRPVDLLKLLKRELQLIELYDSHNVINLDKNSHEVYC